MDVLRCIAYLKDIVMNYLAVGARHPTVKVLDIAVAKWLWTDLSTYPIKR